MSRMHATKEEALVAMAQLVELYREKRRAEEAAFEARYLDSLFGEAAKLKLPWRYDLTLSETEAFHSVVIGPSACPEPGCTTDHANPIAWDIGEESAKLIVQAVNHLFAQYEAEKE